MEGARVIEINNVTVIYGRGTPNENIALRSLSLSIHDRDFITIVGSNGAGKSTLLNLVAGSVPVERGSIVMHKKSVTREPEYRRARRIGRVFQNPLLGTASNMAIEDNLVIAGHKGAKRLVLSLTRRKRREFRELVGSLGMGLEERLRDNVGLLSGGQRQALTLLMLVLSGPEIALLDEHIAALDPRNAQLILDLTERYVRDYQLTALMVTHNMGHAIRYGNRLLMMDRGEIILDVSGPEKQKLTVASLVTKFHEIRRESLQSDEVLLTDGS